MRWRADSKYPLRLRSERHGETRGNQITVEYATWSSMLRRCYNDHVQNYARYGGKGVRVCRRWHRFTNFLADMGRRPSNDHTIERRRNDRNYTPSNCYWATRAEQARNTSYCWRIRIAGVTRTAVEWCTILRLPDKRIYTRLAAGWTPHEALLLPLSQRLRRPKFDRATVRAAVVLLRAGEIDKLSTRTTFPWTSREYRLRHPHKPRPKP